MKFLLLNMFCCCPYKFFLRSELVQFLEQKILNKLFFWFLYILHNMFFLFCSAFICILQPSKAFVKHNIKFFLIFSYFLVILSSVHAPNLYVHILYSSFFRKKNRRETYQIVTFHACFFLLIIQFQELHFIPFRACCPGGLGAFCAKTPRGTLTREQ